MKLIYMNRENKSYNGMDYVEFNLRLIDGDIKRSVRVTGKIPVIAVEPDGNTTELGRLDKCGLTLGSDIVFWFDLQNRINMIEVHTEDPAPVPPDDIPPPPIPF